jgi:hypothetical protein
VVSRFFLFWQHGETSTVLVSPCCHGETGRVWRFRGKVPGSTLGAIIFVFFCLFVLLCSKTSEILRIDEIEH